MLKLLLGYTTHATHETPDVLFVGHDGDALESAIAKAPEKYIRMTRVAGPTEFPASRPRPSVKKAVEDTFKEVDQASESITDSADTESDAEDILTGSGESSGKKRRR